MPSSINIDNLGEVSEALKEVFLSEKGLQGGIYPYLIIKEKESTGRNYFVIHAEASIKFNGFKTENEDLETLRSFRFSGGLEYGRKIKDRYLAVSLTPTLVLLDEERTMDLFSTELKEIFGAELSVAFPLFKVLDIPIALGAELTYDDQNDFSFGMGILAPISIPLGKDSNENSDQ